MFAYLNQEDGRSIANEPPQSPIIEPLLDRESNPEARVQLTSRQLLPPVHSTPVQEQENEPNEGSNVLEIPDRQEQGSYSTCSSFRGCMRFLDK